MPRNKTTDFIMLSERDNVAIALKRLEEGHVVNVGSIKVAIKEEIDFGHKFAVASIKSGENVIKGGEVIGVAKKDIFPGEHVHVHNLGSLRARKQA